MPRGALLLQNKCDAHRCEAMRAVLLPHSNLQLRRRHHRTNDTRHKVSRRRSEGLIGKSFAANEKERL